MIERLWASLTPNVAVSRDQFLRDLQTHKPAHQRLYEEHVSQILTRLNLELDFSPQHPRDIRSSLQHIDRIHWDFHQAKDVMTLFHFIQEMVCAYQKDPDSDSFPIDIDASFQYLTQLCQKCFELRVFNCDLIYLRQIMFWAFNQQSPLKEEVVTVSI
jgi:hypothetical protein